MKCYAVIDTNVLISAMLSKNDNSAAAQILEHLLNGDIIPIYSKEIVREYWEVLLRRKFEFPFELVKVLLTYIQQNGICIVPTLTNDNLIDMKDLPFYEVVMDTRTEKSFLVTENLKYLPKRDYIVTPGQLLDILENKNSI